MGERRSVCDTPGAAMAGCYKDGKGRCKTCYHFAADKYQGTGYCYHLRLPVLGGSPSCPDWMDESTDVRKYAFRRRNDEVWRQICLESAERMSRWFPHKREEYFASAEVTAEHYCGSCERCGTLTPKEANDKDVYNAVCCLRSKESRIGWEAACGEWRHFDKEIYDSRSSAQ